METINTVEQLPFILFLSIHKHNENVHPQNKQGQVLNAKKKSKISICFFQNLCSFPVFTVKILFVEANTCDYIFKSIPATNLTLALLMTLSLRPG